MENAIEALQMAAAMLVFVVAISVSISAFGEARVTAQIIVDNQDREYLSSYVEDNGTTERIVGIESIIPSIYRSYNENFKIVFEAESIIGSEGIYQKKVDGDMVPINYIDLQRENLRDDADKINFIKAILYGADNETKTKLQKEKGIYLNNKSLYDKIKDKKFKEYLGIYYLEETDGATDAPDINKTKKRVITYTGA